MTLPGKRRARKHEIRSKITDAEDRVIYEGPRIGLTSVIWAVMLMRSGIMPEGTHLLDGPTWRRPRGWASLVAEAEDLLNHENIAS